ncbi:MAG: CBS domain-containing protein [Chlorobiales bacterium]|jgi:CBS domain-containing protein|nr:CBS domain-containing protein [Chlorobiales bacterium]
MDQLKKLRTMPVSALMTKNVISMDGSKTVADAIQIMKTHNISSIVIKPRNEDDTYGIVTEKDILEKVIDPGEDIHRDPWNTPVFEVMSKPIISVYPELRVKYALRLMKRIKIRRVAVMDGSKLVGILTETDVLHAVEQLPPHVDQAAY